MNISQLNWEKMQGLIPAIVQDDQTLQVLMLGYMNQEALQQTLSTGQVTFYSRSKERLWVKGETSGHGLTLVKMLPDCDQDAILIVARPNGPCCHLNQVSCFGLEDAPGVGMLARLERLVDERYRNRDLNSYTSNLFEAGIYRIAQKVGEEGVEVALAGVSGVKQDIVNEMADLIFHLFVLKRASGVEMSEICSEIRRRANEKK